MTYMEREKKNIIWYDLKILIVVSNWFDANVCGNLKVCLFCTLSLIHLLYFLAFYWFKKKSTHCIIIFIEIWYFTWSLFVYPVKLNCKQNKRLSVECTLKIILTRRFIILDIPTNYIILKDNIWSQSFSCYNY